MMMVEVTQADRTAAENFVADLRCDMTGTQVHNLAGLLAYTRTQSTADLQVKLDMAVEALGLVEKHLRHQAAFISKINDRPIIRAYSFESLGEDMPQIVAAIEGAKA